VPLGGVFVWLAADALAVSVPSWWFWCLFLLMVVLSFWTYYFLKIIVGFMAFWFTEIWWLIGGLEVMNLLFSGFMIPVDLMPVAFQKISAALPFQYLIYLPTQTILGKLQVNQIGLAIGVQLFWLLTIAWLARWVWRKGIKNYTAYGN
jgi:ABC-2 type transport system permease protein